MIDTYKLLKPHKLTNTMKIPVEKRIDKNGYKISRICERDSRELVFVRSKCIACGLCEKVCPTKAISLGALGAIVSFDRKKDINYIEIDEKKCVLCGLCVGVCLKNALSLSVNGKNSEELHGFMKISRNFTVDKNACVPYENGQICDKCEKICPTDVFKVVKNQSGDYTLIFDEERCYYCGACVKECPKNAIKVKRPFEGNITIDSNVCTACGLCEEICPLKAIYKSKSEIPYKRGDIYKVREEFCIYCGACYEVCPVAAITITRSKYELENASECAWDKTWKRWIAKIEKY